MEPRDCPLLQLNIGVRASEPSGFTGSNTPVLVPGFELDVAIYARSRFLLRRAFCVYEEPLMMKECTRCHQLLPVASFANHSRTRDGLQYYCRSCCTELTRLNRASKRPYKPLVHEHPSVIFSQLPKGHVIRIISYHGEQTRDYEHRIVWRNHFGAIPDGYVIHHTDGNPENNDISNLRCMWHADHLRLHHLANQRPCLDCGGTRRRAAKDGLCPRCRVHLKRYGLHFPEKPTKVIVFCPNHPERPVRAKGLCHSCVTMQAERLRGRKSRVGLRSQGHSSVRRFAI